MARTFAKTRRAREADFCSSRRVELTQVMILPEATSRSITWTGSRWLSGLGSPQLVGLNWSARMERISETTWISSTETRSGTAHWRILSIASIVLTRTDQTLDPEIRLRQAIDEFA
jgi:hypothetical protein